MMRPIKLGLESYEVLKADQEIGFRSRSLGPLSKLLPSYDIQMRDVN
jgi:hypothetical protein